MQIALAIASQLVSDKRPHSTVAPSPLFISIIAWRRRIRYLDESCIESPKLVQNRRSFWVRVFVLNT